MKNRQELQEKKEIFFLRSRLDYSVLLVAVAVVRCHQAKREKVQISVSSNKQLVFIISLFHCRIGKFYASWTITKHYENEWKNERTNGSNSIQEREYNLRIW